MTGPQRASDAEREAVAQRLRHAAGEGRLTPEELDERLTEAYRSKTLAELDALTADLPAPLAPTPPGEPAWKTERVRKRAASFVTVNLVCNAIWLATGAPHGDYWPMWVWLFTGIALVAALVHAVMGVEEEEYRRRHRHQLPR
jgi:hypothetical protein